MFFRPFESITIDDIVKLKEDSISEGRSIDYKLELHIEERQHRKELCADLSSFANTIGGDIIFGVSENNGQIEEILGIEVADKDALKLQIESIVRDSISPRIIGLQNAFYDMPEGKTILHIRIPQSLTGPHVVAGQVFYGRNSAGKYPLDYSEIRSKFLGNFQIGETIKDFHINRIFKVKAGEGYTPLTPGPAILVHLIPINSLSYDSPIYELGSPEGVQLWPLYGTNCDYHIGLEGIAWYSIISNSNISYHHLSRNGLIELVDKGLLLNEHKKISINTIEEKLIRALETIKANYIRFNIDGPFMFKISLIDIHGYSLNYLGRGNQVQRDNDLILREKFIENLNVRSDQIIEQFIIQLCNAAGLVTKPQRDQVS